MRLVPSFNLSYPDVRALRIALAAGAVAGLVVIAACTDSGSSKSITAPGGIRKATIGSGGFGQARTLILCVDISSPPGTYVFKNTALNRSIPQEGHSYTEPLAGNGAWDGTYWNDAGDGGDGSSTANALVNVNYDVGVGPGGCVLVLHRDVGDADFMASLPISDGGPCDPSVKTCGGVLDRFAAVNILPVSNTAGAVYNHTDCLIDDGTLMPQHVNPTTGNPPVPTTAWPQGGYNASNPAFANYGCGSSNFATRGFVNYEHGATITYFFTAPTTHNCTFTQGYYKNHESYTAGVLSGNAGTTYIDGAGKLIIGTYHLSAAQVDAILGTPVGKGYNAGGVVFTSAQLGMIHQLITAELNLAGGANGASIVATITAANNYTGATKKQLSDWTDALDNFNNGKSGPNHCS